MGLVVKISVWDIGFVESVCSGSKSGTSTIDLGTKIDLTLSWLASLLVFLSSIWSVTESGLR